ncbi:AbrB/MazE/SpoVT family DNA-binding domain-containing protein [Haloplanus aerogenes]|uniref:AbrB/MazE/SpoVT family DNA-binding domain-containing protein n=1 Tax=Haloplanus aerogenes TaxID=660522 RepID=A0A3M0CYR2_9EURY|nr:AbrB/MazE/SpoVT family DNA-binding domain-containing protein [Haloplanus aerogenes]AZH26551.1 AbrB/MazE/SpoVT family DNA-binding domain-containing protein [Haloplanus aerogenes]RMB12779.1 putative antitoxin-like MraZ protein [Haloplanus aerogenes]
MTEVTLDDRGRLTLPKQLRERFGDRFHVVELHDGIKLVPVAEDPLAALRDEFDDVDKTAEELRASGREEALDEAGP